MNTKEQVLPSIGVGMLLFALVEIIKKAPPTPPQIVVTEVILH